MLHRVPWSRRVARIIGAATAPRRPRILFDIDDLLFDPEAMAHMAMLRDMSSSDLSQWTENIARNRRTMTASDACLVSTESLERHASRVVSEVVVSPNVVSRQMIAWSNEILVDRSQRERRDDVVVGYFSGSATHDLDFAEAAEALLRVLDKRPHTRLLIVGPLSIDTRFSVHADRVHRLPFMDYRSLMENQAEVDISIAPLERNNPFTESKSCVKWLESSLMGVPTIASARSDFVRVIQQGETGLLADSPEEWECSLLELVDDRAARARIGKHARESVLSSHTTTATCSALYSQVSRLESCDGSRLVVNWFLYSPIAAIGGGYRNIFRIADFLASKGHRQRFLIEPVAHLAGMTEDEIRAFVEDAFGVPDGAEVFVQDSEMPAADVSVATFWPTAQTVSHHRKSLFRAYFVQDFEPEFYDQSDERFEQARATYFLPLRHICLGRHLALRLETETGLPSNEVDFALDDCFRLTRDPANRGERVRVLFFARPGLRRRGFEVGVAALAEAKRRRPEITVSFFGSKDDDVGRVPFEFENLGVLTAEQVSEAMNASHVLLTFSLTNISNVPYEGMACGCAVLDLDLPNVSTMADGGETCLLEAFEPMALAAAIVRLVDDESLRRRLGLAGAKFANEKRWERTGDMFEAALLGMCFSRLPDELSRGTIRRRLHGFGAR